MDSNDSNRSVSMIECCIDLNVDVGEGGAMDGELIAMGSSANIACGGHAGDAGTLRAAIDACMARGVAIGAHPGHEDPDHFGRRPLNLPSEKIRSALLRQLDRFARCAALAGVPIHHVKFHGALYHQANNDPALADTLAAAVAGIFPGCFIYTTARGSMAGAAGDCGLIVVPEGFADRRYTAAGGLVPRGEPGAVITDPATAVAQALEIARHQRVCTVDETWLPLPARTLCTHGDTPCARQIMQSIITAMARHGIRLMAP
jgi:UPF0271 protein